VLRKNSIRAGLEVTTPRVAEPWHDERVIALAKIAVLIHYLRSTTGQGGTPCPHRRVIFVRNDVKEKLARGEVVMLPILLHQNR
jgi:hypothetical protein